jgi:hypothetical protein
MNQVAHILQSIGARAAVLVLTAIVLGGCDAGRVIGPNNTLEAGEDSAAFLDRVSSQENVSENDALRGILLLLDGEDTAKTFQERIDRLRERNIVDGSWDFSADRPISRGKYAYMIYQASKIPGGVVLSLTGPSQRYCLRELQYRSVMVQGVTYMAVSGLEYISVLSRADTYRRTGKVPGLAGDTEDL